MFRATSFAAIALAAAVLAIGASPFVAAQPTHNLVAADAVKWGPAPPGLPKGSQVAVLLGDPEKSGVFILRAKLPDGYTVPPHWHSQAEHLTVLSGRLNVGMGDKVDTSKAQTLGPGGFASMPAKMRHYVSASGETVIQVTGTGPFDVNYVDPKDDPRQGTTGAR